MREARGLEEIRRAARAPPIRSARPVLAGRATRSGAAEGIPRAIGLVKRIDATHAATAADGLPALIKGREVTIRSATSPAAAVIRAPRIQRITALLSARRQAGESQSNSCKKKRCAHVALTFQSINEPFGPCQATKAFASGWKWRGRQSAGRLASSDGIGCYLATLTSILPKFLPRSTPARSPALRRHARDT